MEEDGGSIDRALGPSSGRRLLEQRCEAPELLSLAVVTLDWGSCQRDARALPAPSLPTQGACGR
eukprot:241002-Pyramimonas_sp.AAC.1